MKHIFNICILTLILTLLTGCEKHANYPSTYRVGWVTKENIKWEALELSANFKHENFNLTNSEGHIIIKAKIKVLRNEDWGNWNYKIEKLHIIQRYIEGNTTIALIEITPIFKSIKNKSSAESAVYDLLINEPIQNRNWGPNYYRVKIGNKHVDLKTSQRK